MFALLEIWLVLSLVAAWAATVLAVALDARARIDNPSATRAAALLAAALPIAGGALWLCVRPGETRLQRRERRLVVGAYAWAEPWTVQAPAPVPAAAGLQQAAA